MAVVAERLKAAGHFVFDGDITRPCESYFGVVVVTERMEVQLVGREGSEAIDNLEGCWLGPLEPPR